jgi:6-phosphogluconolactonase
MRRYPILFIALSAILLFLNSCQEKTIRLFASRYNEAGEKGLVVFDLNRGAGSFKVLSEGDAGPNPSYFCISEKKELIYAANEVMEFNGEKGGGVTVLRYSPETGNTEKIKELMVPKGGPCYISLSPREDYLLLASYSSASIAVVKLDDKGLPLNVTDTISFPPNEKSVSHPHMIAFGPAGKKVYLTDLGLDRIMIFDFDNATGRLSPAPDGIINLPEGSGPRHFVFSQTGTKLYIICELNSTITVFDVNENGGLRSIQTQTTLGDGFAGKSFCADIHLSESGKYLYGTNRGENTIVVFTVETDGKLSLAGRTSCGGNWPRNFVIDPSGKYILIGNQKSGEISLFRIDAKTGMPNYIDDYKFGTPACLKF